jgi:hypothetical protein
MHRKILFILIALAEVFAAVGLGWALDARGIARLKQAGIEDATIETMTREQTVETAAFTVDDILAMKASGIGEETLRALIRDGSFMKNREPVVYGNDLRSIRLTTADDLIRIKQAGVSDEVLQAIVEVSRRGADTDRESAMRRLQEMGVWVEFPR